MYKVGQREFFLSQCNWCHGVALPTGIYGTNAVQDFESGVTLTEV